MTFSIFRSRCSFGTSASKSTMIGSCRASFLQFSMKTPPFPLLYQKQGRLGSFLTSCIKTLPDGERFYFSRS